MVKVEYPHLSDKAQHDLKLIKSAKKGDQQAFAELLERYRDTIFYMLLKIVNNKTDAEDLTIEAFSKAFKNLEQYSPEFAFSTWLFKIATNNCIDFLRKKKSSLKQVEFVEEPTEEDEEPIFSTLIRPDDEIINKQIASLMHTVVAKLKPRYRQLVELRYFKEYSYEEISIEMNLPIGTVKAQLFRARDLLYNILKLKHTEH